MRFDWKNWCFRRRRCKLRTRTVRKWAFFVFGLAVGSKFVSLLGYRHQHHPVEPELVIPSTTDSSKCPLSPRLLCFGHDIHSQLRKSQSRTGNMGETVRQATFRQFGPKERHSDASDKSLAENGLFKLHDGYLNNFDWFMKVDDDTYIIMEHLKELLAKYSPDDPVALGHKMRLGSHIKGLEYHSGGAGYVFTRESLRRFVKTVQMLEENRDKHVDLGLEDVHTAYVWKKANVTIVETSDENLALRFAPIHIAHILTPELRPKWLKSMEKPLPEKNALSNKLFDALVHTPRQADT
ncbi:unnamed protein product [Caenorhabditis auriculariae]|uniref:N-acetylgalactosaminide beta-1,3-galactosyltransferase n=1 Tax=Caenorhabditis auriculariae TaxID=2777116 RepID=A0A8S1HTN9_9PELO|nr:unnamed protein product [Caenorhabditis auriculariae]